jgi:hypothetical protein
MSYLLHHNARNKQCKLGILCLTRLLRFRGLPIYMYSLFYSLPYSQYVVQNVVNYSLHSSLFLFYLDLELIY